MDAKPTGLPANTLEVRTRIFITIPVEVQIVIASYVSRAAAIITDVFQDCSSLTNWYKLAAPTSRSQRLVSELQGSQFHCPTKAIQPACYKDSGAILAVGYSGKSCRLFWQMPPIHYSHQDLDAAASPESWSAGRARGKTGDSTQRISRRSLSTLPAYEGGLRCIECMDAAALDEAAREAVSRISVNLSSKPWSPT